MIGMPNVGKCTVCGQWVPGRYDSDAGMRFHIRPIGTFRLDTHSKAEEGGWVTCPGSGTVPERSRAVDGSDEDWKPKQ